MKKTNPLFLSPRELKEREEKKKALEKEISEKIKKKISGTHFKACPWCGIEPWIDVECYSDCSSYRTVLKTCDHLDYHMFVDDYKIHKIPKDPLIYPNPRRRVDERVGTELYVPRAAAPGWEESAADDRSY